MILTYNGFLQLGYGESDEALCLSTLDQPLAEELKEIHNKKVTVSYYTAIKECSYADIEKSFLKLCIGLAEVEFDAAYSEITGYLYTTEELMIGGHSLLDELKSHVGRYIYLKIEVHE